MSQTLPPPDDDPILRGDNLRMVGKLVVVAALMFGFGYALVPIYKSICEALGINVLSLSEKQAAPYFNKLECFCFNEYTLKSGESKHWPVVFVIDPKIPKDVTTITLSYTFFEVGGKIPAAPQAAVKTTEPKS